MRFDSPWQYWQLTSQFTGTEPDEYDFSTQPQAKERAGGGRTKAKTRDWEHHAYEAAEEFAPDTPPAGRMGLEVLYLINSTNPPKHDLSNAIKTLEDAFNRRAYKDDQQIDYLKALRVYGPDEPNRIIARVYEQCTTSTT